MPARQTRYAATVTKVGEDVLEHLPLGIMILFAENAPEELHFFSVIHRPEQTTGGVRAGDTIRIDDRELVITAVGDLANENLVALGHISLKATGAEEAPLPGDVCVEAVPLPEVRPGSRFLIEGPDTGVDVGAAGTATNE
jgi:glucitol/sorbitol PTS system EIIA component